MLFLDFLQFLYQPTLILLLLLKYYNPWSILCIITSQILLICSRINKHLVRDLHPNREPLLRIGIEHIKFLQTQNSSALSSSSSSAINLVLVLKQFSLHIHITLYTTLAPQTWWKSYNQHHNPSPKNPQPKRKHISKTEHFITTHHPKKPQPKQKHIKSRAFLPSSLSSEVLKFNTKERAWRREALLASANRPTTSTFQPKLPTCYPKPPTYHIDLPTYLPTYQNPKWLV